jgi:hypothetical protein
MLKKRKMQTKESDSHETSRASGGDEYSSMSHPFFSLHGLASKQKIIITVVTFAIVGSIATYATNAAQMNSEDTVRLSNRIQVKLGDPISVVSAKLGNKLYKLSERQYEYPGKADKPIEVVFDVENGKVVVIHVVSNRANTLNAAQGTLGTNLQQMATSNRRTRAVTGELAKLRQQALFIDQSRSAQYYIPEPCPVTATTDLVSLVLKGYEHRLIEDMGGSSCIRD